MSFSNLRTLFLRLFALIYFLVGVRSLDYCKYHCGSGKVHIGCEADSTSFGPDCPSDVTRVDLEPHIGAILDAHNTPRNLVASGKLGSFKPAARMATMLWHDELAELAFLNAKTCSFKHDSCHSVPFIPYPGQNLAATMWSGYSMSDVEVLEREIDSWFLEHVHATMDQIYSYGRGTDGHTIGHFTIVINQNNSWVGCGAVKYTKGHYTTLSLTCNYAVTNFIGMPVYQPSDTPGTGCQTGTNPEFEALCSTDEMYLLE